MKFAVFSPIAFCCIFLFPSSGLSFEDEEVHPQINEYSVNQSHLDEFLQEEIGFQDGIGEYLIDGNGLGQEVFRWFRQGGTDEDSGFRSFNHFHDPTIAWQDAELWGWVGTSSVIWDHSGWWSMMNMESFITFVPSGMVSNSLSRYYVLEMKVGYGNKK